MFSKIFDFKKNNKEDEKKQNGEINISETLLMEYQKYTLNLEQKIKCLEQLQNEIEIKDLEIIKLKEIIDKQNKKMDKLTTKNLSLEKKVVKKDKQIDKLKIIKDTLKECITKGVTI